MVLSCRFCRAWASSWSRRGGRAGRLSLLWSCNNGAPSTILASSWSRRGGWRRRALRGFGGCPMGVHCSIVQQARCATVRCARHLCRPHDRACTICVRTGAQRGHHLPAHGVGAAHECVQKQGGRVLHARRLVQSTQLAPRAHSTAGQKTLQAQRADQAPVGKRRGVIGEGSDSTTRNMAVSEHPVERPEQAIVCQRQVGSDVRAGADV